MLNETRNILDRLAAADREHQKEAGARLLLGSVKYACLGILAAFVLDVVFHLKPGWRLALLLAFILAGLALLIAAWQIAYVRKNRLAHIARFLEACDPTLGSRLINLLQLADQMGDDSLGPLTRDLARQAVDGYTAGMRDLPLEQLARTGEWHRHLKHAALAFLVFAAVLATIFHITVVEMARFADPYGDHPPYSFTRLEIIQPGAGGTNVIYGGGLVVKVKALGHQPKEVLLSAYPPGHPEQAVTLPMFDKEKAGFSQLLDTIQSELVVVAHTRDHVSVSKQARIGVVLTPRLSRAFVRVAPPAYTKIPAAEKPYDFKGIQALEGSEVKFRLQSNRPLRDGWMEITGGEQPPKRIALQLTASNEVSGALTAAESGRLRFGFVDVAGLPSQGDWEGALTITHDLPPEIHLANPAHDGFVALDFKLQAQIEASDDYGLREIRFQRGLNGVFSAPKVFHYDGIVLDSRETSDFNLAELGVEPGDVISLFAEAIDNAPQPHRASSQIARLQVISVEDYNNFLREQTDLADTEAKYSELNDQLEDLLEQQKQLGQEMEKLKEQTGKADARQKEALTQSLDSLVARQNELNQKLNQQADRMEHFVRPNPVYDVEQDLQDLLRQEAAAIRASTQTNSGAARRVAQQSSPPGGPRQLTPDMPADLKQASDDQVARLGGAQKQTEEQVAQTLEDLTQMQELTKDFSAFESLYRTQQDLARQAQAYNRPGQLSREDQLALQDLASTEKQLADALGQLRFKLRDDARAAGKLFPKAAKSGRDLADQLEQRRLQPMATAATSEMLAGTGDQSFQLADRLRGEMEKMFTECQGGNCPSKDELDSYLRLLHMKPGNNFAQMSRSRKLGLGRGRGQQGGSGEGMMGTAGYAVTQGNQMDVLGNETFSRRGNGPPRQSDRYGAGASAFANSKQGSPENPDVLTGLNPANRESGAVASEAVIQEYQGLVDTYFKTITTKKRQGTNE